MLRQKTNAAADQIHEGLGWLFPDRYAPPPDGQPYYRRFGCPVEGAQLLDDLDVLADQLEEQHG